MNVIARLEFELAYDQVAVQHVNNYTPGTPLCNAKPSVLKNGSGII